MSLVAKVFACMALFAASTGMSSAANYATCILDKMPGSENEAITTAVVNSCQQDNPGGFYDIPKGSGKGIFSFKEPNSCILKKAKDTKNQRAAYLIAASCRCLYGEPEYQFEQCALRP